MFGMGRPAQWHEVREREIERERGRDRERERLSHRHLRHHGVLFFPTQCIVALLLLLLLPYRTSSCFTLTNSPTTLGVCDMALAWSGCESLSGWQCSPPLIETGSSAATLAARACALTRNSAKKAGKRKKQRWRVYSPSEDHPVGLHPAFPQDVTSRERVESSRATWAKLRDSTQQKNRFSPSSLLS